MITEDQSSVVALLSSPDTHGGARVERIDTHTSIVFLAGERAWKLKRAVRYAYLDYSTEARRRAMCEAEVRLNRRTAPSLYRGVTAITRQPDGTLALGGDGTPVDWVVAMTRFAQSGMLDRLAEAGLLPLRSMPALAHTIARFHQAADGRHDLGGWEAMRGVINGNAAGFKDDAAGILDPAMCARLTERARFTLDRGGMILDRRRDEGMVRHCHGDLHLRNVVLLDGQPTLFDAIEFSDEISVIDVLYDLAFLLMDLWRMELPHHANAVWNSYLSETADLDGVALMPLFLSCRAAVMAKTTATTANLHADGRHSQLQALATHYLALADRLLEPAKPALIAIGGLSGSGKSTLAMALAPAVGAVPGAVVIRSDEIRKRLCGVGPLDRLGPEGYSDDMSRRVYAALMQQADTIVRSGYSAIADAVFQKSAQRFAVQHVAAAAGVPFIGIWLDAPEDVLRSRLESRDDDVSDADVDVLRRQLAAQRGLPSWHRLDASGTRQDTCEAAAAIVGGDHLCRVMPASAVAPR